MHQTEKQEQQKNTAATYLVGAAVTACCGGVDGSWCWDADVSRMLRIRNGFTWLCSFTPQ